MYCDIEFGNKFVFCSRWRTDCLDDEIPLRRSTCVAGLLEVMGLVGWQQRIISACGMVYLVCRAVIRWRGGNEQRPSSETLGTGTGIGILPTPPPQSLFFFFFFIDLMACSGATILNFSLEAHSARSRPKPPAGHLLKTRYKYIYRDDRFLISENSFIHSFLPSFLSSF